jgi:hypothetical protein
MGYLSDKLTCIGSHLLTYHFKYTTYPMFTFSHLLLGISNIPLIQYFFSHQRLIISNISLVQYFFFPPTTYCFKYASYPTMVVSHQPLVISNRKLLEGKKIPSQWGCFPATHQYQTAVPYIMVQKGASLIRPWLVHLVWGGCVISTKAILCSCGMEFRGNGLSNSWTGEGI